MSILDTNDALFLIRAINQNLVVLFLGAGSSNGATNSLGAKMPLGKELATDMWVWLGYAGAYDGTALADMYQAVLASGMPFSQVQDFLNSRLLCSDVPSTYDPMARISWYRIYTTNADNLLDFIWRRGAESHLEVLKYPTDDVRERDQLLNRTQAIYLHGKLPCRPDELTFSTRQYAYRATTHDPLYEQFVRDYSTHPVVFCGTELNEPLFWQYVEARQARGHAPSEQRPKSFLIARRISPAKKATLRDLNVVPVEASTEEFLAWIVENGAAILPRSEVLKLTVPTFPEILLAATDGGGRRKELGEFSLAFHKVPVSTTSHTASRSNFLLGTTPRWEDILSDLDAPRTLTSELLAAINERYTSHPQLQVMPILGSAGCGKSTILRRVGLSLAQSGIPTFLTNSEELPRPNIIARAVDAMPGRVVLLFDNSEGALSLLPAVAKELQRVDRPPILVLAARTNDFDRRVGRFDDGSAITEFPVPHLNQDEIRAVLDTLDRNHLLGRLRGMSPAERIKEFQIRAHRQILVAMREATTGEGFNEILIDEFAKLDGAETKILYLCVALATDAGYRIRLDELVGCAVVKPAEALHLINRSLRDIVLHTGVANDLLLLRHRRIAEFMVDEAAPRDLLAVAYIRLLRVLADQLGDRNWRSRTFGFYRNVINHLTIYNRFARDVGAARDIYESLREQFKSDPHFWLQYGSLELEGDVLDRAENYLAQATSLDPNDRFVKNAIAHLMLRKAIVAENKAQALKLRDQGSEILLDAVSDDTADIYSFHILCSQRFGWIRKWGMSVAERRAELEELRRIMSRASQAFPRARELTQLREDIEREYLGLAVSTDA